MVNPSFRQTLEQNENKFSFRSSLGVITKAIIPVAGLGTRFLPATKAQPKEMLPIVDKPVIQYLVEEAVAAGIKEIIFVTGKEKRAIEDHFDEAHALEETLRGRGKADLAKTVKSITTLARFAYVRQPEPNGNGMALLSAAHLIGNESVAVLFGDDIVDSKVPTLKRLIDLNKEFGLPVLALDRVERNQVSNYGIVSSVKIKNRVFKIDGIIEKPAPKFAPSRLAVVGKYILTPDIFRILKDMSAISTWNEKRELGITDALAEFLKTGKIIGYEIEGTRYDCGSKLGLLKATIDYGLRHDEVGKAFRNYLKDLKI